ncbi:Ovotransferrin [Varanus komodoensis]|nr:Ovotransferrin [Varanus komodoensis]
MERTFLALRATSEWIACISHGMLSLFEVDGIISLLSFTLSTALCLATSPVKWCTTSTAEQEKCSNLQRCLNKQQLPNLPQFGCVRKTDYLDCIRAIANKEADAITLDGGQIFDANLHPHNLKPVIAEVYRRIDGDKHSYYAVAVVKQNTTKSFADLKGNKSCHTGWGRSAGWVAPVGMLLEKNYTMWEGKEIEPVEKAVARFFSASCVPGAPKEEPNLCRLCAGTGSEKCSRNDPFAGYSGAFE